MEKLKLVEMSKVSDVQFNPLETYTLEGYEYAIVDDGVLVKQINSEEVVLVHKDVLVLPISFVISIDDRLSNHDNFVHDEIYIPISVYNSLRKLCYTVERYADNSMELSTRGDYRYHSVSAKFSDGRCIEEVFQFDIKGLYGHVKTWYAARTLPHLTNLTQGQLFEEYIKLWDKYFEENPYLLNELETNLQNKGVTILTDYNIRDKYSSAVAIATILNRSIFRELTLV